MPQCGDDFRCPLDGILACLVGGRFGVVVRYNRKEPLRPTVIVAFAADGTRLPEAELKLLKPEELSSFSPTRIASYAGEDLAYTHENPMAPCTPAEINSCSTLIETAYP